MISKKSPFSSKMSVPIKTNKDILIKIQNSVLNLIDVSSVLHGLPNIIRSKRLLMKLIWLVSTLISISVCFIFISLSVLNFLNFDYILNNQKVIQHPMQFPTISLCSTSYSFNKTSLKNLTTHCLFNLNDTCLNNPDAMFERYTDPKYGTCYRFNSGKNMRGERIDFLNSYVGGRSHGLQLEINEQNGIALFIHNHTKLPYPFETYNNLNGDTVLVPGEFETDIIIHKENYLRLGEPYNQCLKNPLDFQKNKTLIEWILNKNQTYRNQHCLYLCLDLFYINQNPCNCSAKIGGMWRSCFRDAENSNKTGCTFNYKLKFYQGNVIDKCSQYCPYECDSETFSRTLSFRRFNSSKLRFYAFYGEMKYTLVEQIPKISYIDLISSIGGIFGLFLGMSFLSFVEIIEILLEVLVICYEAKR